MKKCLLIQSGAFGDLFICAPIAKYYHDLGYEVFWPTRKKFAGVVSHFPYVKHILLNEEELHSDWLRSDTIKCLRLMDQTKFDLVLNLADRGPHPTAQLPYEKLDQTKYRLSNVDFSLKNSLVWDRNETIENEIFEKFVGDEKDYVFVHRTSSDNNFAEIPKEISGKIVEIQEYPNDDIVGWYKVIMNAKAVFCVESSVQSFIDGFVTSLPCPAYLLSRPTLNSGQTYTVAQHWDKRYLK